MSTTPVTRSEMRMSGAGSLLMDRAEVVLLRACRIVGAAWSRWRQQTRQKKSATHGGLLTAIMGRALTAKAVRGRMLSVEERMTLGPKQHMYLIRCGDRRLLVASAGEAALQWMSLPGEDELCSAAVPDASISVESGVKSRVKPRTDSSRAGAKRQGRTNAGAACASATERMR